MGQLLLILAVALVVGVIVFGVAVLVTGSDSGLEPAEPDASAVPLPTHRPLGEGDLSRVRFDLALRGYRMSQVDQAMRRAAYDIGYKDELIGVLEAEVVALRAGRGEEADALRRAREAALVGTTADPAPEATPAEPATESEPDVIELGPAAPVAVPPRAVPPRAGPVADLVPGTSPVPGPPPATPATDGHPDEPVEASASDAAPGPVPPGPRSVGSEATEATEATREDGTRGDPGPARAEASAGDAVPARAEASAGTTDVTGRRG